MLLPIRPALPLFLTALAVPMDASQQGLATSIAMERPFGAAQEGEIVRAVGRDYRARFDRAGLELTPGLGRLAPRSLPVRYKTRSIGREDAVLLTVPDVQAAPSLHDSTVTVQHGLGVLERYHLDPEHVELTFVFPERPPGSGDLVVRGQLDTELVPDTREDDDPVILRSPFGGVEIGTVTGVDARGRMAAGRIVLGGNTIDFVLPGEFVDTATYPMVLDPFLWVFSDVSPGTESHYPDVAYAFGPQAYMVVWERWWSATDQDIYGQRLTQDGALLGPTLLLEPDIDPVARFPSVGYRLGQFVVAWQYEGFLGEWDIAGRGVGVSTGTVGPQNNICIQGGDQTKPDVASSLGSLEALVVYHDSNLGIRYAGVSNFGGNWLVSKQTIDPNTATSNPVISKGRGTDNSHLVVYERDYGTDFDLWGAVIHGSPDEPTAPFAIVTSIGEHETLPDCDGGPNPNGDAGIFMVAYEKAPAMGQLPIIECKHVYWDGSFHSVGPPSAASKVPGLFLTRPALAYNGETWILATMDHLDPAYPMVMNLTEGCENCEGESLLGSNPSYHAAVASTWGGGGIDGMSLVVLEQEDAAATTKITAAFHRHAGASEDLGGGCGSAGVASAHCTAVGNWSFRHRLRGGPPLSTAYLIIGFEELGIACSPCTLVPDPFTGFVVTQQTDADGNADVPMAIADLPFLAGLSFIDQWAVPGDETCSLFDVDLSNAVRATIE